MNTADYQVYRDGIEDNYLDDLDSYLDAKERQVKNNDWLELARIVNRYYTIATSHDVARIRRFALTMLYLVALRSDYDYVGDGFSDVGLLYDWISAIDFLNSTKGIEL